jgi:hypothetical protein
MNILYRGDFFMTKNRRITADYVRRHGAKMRGNTGIRRGNSGVKRRADADIKRRVGNGANVPNKGTFMLRLNICLGITVALVGIVKMNNSIALKTRDYIMQSLEKNITETEIESEKAKIKAALGISRQYVILDDDVIEYIENEKNKENKADS